MEARSFVQVCFRREVRGSFDSPPKTSLHPPYPLKTIPRGAPPLPGRPPRVTGERLSCATHKVSPRERAGFLRDWSLKPPEAVTFSCAAARSLHCGDSESRPTKKKNAVPKQQSCVLSYAPTRGGRRKQTVRHRGSDAGGRALAKGDGRLTGAHPVPERE